MTRGVIFPELITGREDDVINGPWTVREGSTARGSASCNLAERVLEVPLASSAQARVVRAHELMHARVSPMVDHLLKSIDEVTPRALECAEELRVNTLLARLNFEVALLRDGTEKIGGRRVAEAGEWGEAICFMMAVLGTGAEREYMAGVRQGKPAWMPAMRAVRKRALDLLARQSTTILGATRLDGDGLPSGYATSTLEVARMLTRVLDVRMPSTTEELRAFRRSLEGGGRRPATGHFAPLVFDASLAYRSPPPVGNVRRTRAVTTGTTLRYPSRLLTDDHRRAFAQRQRTRGGVVVIDQSGSMDLDPEVLEGLLRRAPNALVVGYSHRPGDRGSTANAWLLCDRGTIAGAFPSGNVGNGVDGPALRWALTQRQGNEPVVWITDGQVTDSHDHPDAALTLECANLVRQHRIRLVRDLTDASKALRSRPLVTPTHLASFGRVGRQLRESIGI